MRGGEELVLLPLLTFRQESHYPVRTAQAYM